jgi:hypothetical protein
MLHEVMGLGLGGRDTDSSSTARLARRYTALRSALAKGVEHDRAEAHHNQDDTDVPTTAHDDANLTRGAVPLLVSTFSSARGLDLPEVELVLLCVCSTTSLCKPLLPTAPPSSKRTSTRTL